MTDGHCFISYSAADGLDFATKLADELQGRHPNIKVWFDKREMDASIVDWDDQLANAIKACKCLVFVMTPDSTAKGSTCKEEWTWALKYKKPVICLLKDKKADVPFRLNNRQYIDISADFNSGIAQLRSAIKRLDEPEGILEELDRRLSQAKRDFQRTPHEEEKPRIQAEIEELNKQIEAQQKIVDNPKKAEEQTQKNIEAGLERERQPEKPVTGKTSTRFINPPPGIAPTYFQDRLIETKQIADFLHNDAQRLMTIVGRAGVGKTAMICRLLKGIESGKLPDELGEMRADGIVYLSETGSHRINFANIFADLSKLLPNETAAKLEGLYKDPQTSTGDKMRKLLDAFESGRFILLLDNFENLIDSESLHIKDSELSDALNALLQATQHTVKVILTTRIAPRDLALVEPGRQHPLSLDDGLESPYAENVLREMDADGRVGLKSAPDALLNKAREKTRGYPRALEALYAILSVDRYTTLEELLEISLPDEVVQKLVGEAFNRLDPSAQKVMQALAVYNRPVSPAAIDYLLQPHLPSIDSALVLNRLVNMHFARREAGRYYLHPADKEYAFSIIPEKDLTTKDTKVTKENQEDEDALLAIQRELDSLRASRLTNTFTQHDLLNRAADYFAQARKPRAEWKKLEDLSAQLAEFELRCEAGDYDTAADVLTDIDSDYLLLWGHSRLMIDLHKNLEGKLKDLTLANLSIGNLGLALMFIGKVKEAVFYYEKALSMAKERKNRRAEGAWLGNLGNAYYSLGNARKAIECYERVLVISREISDRQYEGNAVGNLGNAYGSLGDTRKAIEFHEQALVIAREVSDRQNEQTLLGNLGGDYVTLGEARRAIEFREQALIIAREISDRGGEGNQLGGLGNAYNALGDTHKAIEFYEQTLAIYKEIGYRRGEGNIFGSMGSAYKHLGNIQKAIEYQEAALNIAQEIGDRGSESTHLSNLGNRYSELAEYEKAIEYYEKSILINKEIDDRNGEANSLGNAGDVWLILENYLKAEENYKQAIQIADEILIPQTQNYARCGLTKVYLFQNDPVNARATIEAALQYDEPENNHNATGLHGIIALRQGERETAQETFMKSIAQADEILARTPDYYSALDAKGLALCGRVVSREWRVENSKERDEIVAEAVKTFKRAREIAPHAGVVKSVLRLFDELGKCDEEGILKDVREAAEGK